MSQQQSIYSLMPLMHHHHHPSHHKPIKNPKPATSCDRLTKFRGREVKNILMDLDQSFNQNKDPPMVHPHPFYSPTSHYSSSSSSRSSSQRSLIHRYGKRRRPCDWSCCCKLTLTLVILVLLAWGTAVPLYFLIGPGINLIRRMPMQGTAEAVSSKFTINSGNGTVQHAVNGSFRIINQRYSHQLTNIYSAEYQTLKLKLETLLSVVYQVEEDFNKAIVTDFKPGSIVANFVLIYNKNQVNVQLQAKSIIHTYLVKHWSMLGTYHIDMGSVTLKGLQNKCLLNNGGCSHLCVWNVLGGESECTCPQNHRLLDDKKTCFPTKIVKVKTTVSPCEDGQFACRSSSCIPHQWLCDGVSDCLLGEDEASAMCEEFALKMLLQNTTAAPGTSNETSTPGVAEVKPTQEAMNTLISGTQIESMPLKKQTTAATKTTHSFNNSIVKGNHRAAIRDEEKQKARQSEPMTPQLQTPKRKSHVSRQQAFVKATATTKDFFDVPTLDLEIDPEEDENEFSKRRQFNFKYFGR